jgi:hypothetical protein
MKYLLAKGIFAADVFLHQLAQLLTRSERALQEPRRGMWGISANDFDAVQIFFTS